MKKEWTMPTVGESPCNVTSGLNYVPDPRPDAKPGDQIPDIGLTKREYFAAMAMQGFIALVGDRVPSDDSNQFIATVMAVKMADDLIIALNKKKETT